MFKIFKQELLFIPLMFILMECLRFALMQYFPETALFDKGSELETFLFSVWQITWITSASLILLRVVFPSAYVVFKTFYHSFSENVNKEIYSLVFYLVFFFGLISLVSGRASTPNETSIRIKLVDTLHSQLLVREATGHNDGIDVEKYLTYVSRFKGDSWCAAFTSWNLNAVGISAPPNPKSGWSPNFSKAPFIVWSKNLAKQHKAQKIKPGDCFTLYYSEIQRVGHVGFIVSETPDYFITIEGNTGLTGSRDGSGVHKYKRAKNKVFAVTNYITPFIQNYETYKTIAYCVGRFNINGIVQPKITTVDTNNYRYYYNISLSKGQHVFKGHNNYYSCRQFADTSNCINRLSWQSKFTRNQNYIRSNRIECFNCERKTNLKMQMFSLRNYATNTATNYREAHKRKPFKTEGADYGSNQRSKIYTEMG